MTRRKKRSATTVNVREAKTHLSRLLQRVAMGEEVVVARAGKPVAKLVPLAPRRLPRTPGAAKGQVEIRDDFDAPLLAYPIEVVA